jgi:hypothetical protein
MTKNIYRRFALTLLVASMFGTAGATVASADANALPKPPVDFST